MVRRLLLFITMLLPGALVYSQTVLTGKVADVESGDTFIGATVSIFKNGVKAGVQPTDNDGIYRFTNIDAGTYDVLVTYIGYDSVRTTGVVVYSGRINTADILMGGSAVLNEVIIKGYKVPLIQQDNTTQGGAVTAAEILNMPTKNINAIAATVAGVSSLDGGELNVKGSRASGTDYYVDGIRVSGGIPPSQDIEQLQVITGGIEAQYGDVTGGIISITTKGPSKKFTGGVELETSKFLDPYGYTMGNANISGPILKKGDKTILGFRLSGQYLHRDDEDPAALPVYTVKDEVIADLEANPVINGVINRAEELTFADMNSLKARRFEPSNNIDITGKLDIRVTDNIFLTVSGGIEDNKDQFTPGGWQYLNSKNNPFNYYRGYRGNVRLRHVLGANPLETSSEVKNNSAIKNASYSLQVGYEKSLNRQEDARHGENYFDYGYIGKYDYIWEPILGLSNWSGALQTQDGNFAHLDDRQVFTGYTPGTINPVLAAYNNHIDPTDVTPATVNDFIRFNGYTVGPYGGAWDFFPNVGAVYNQSQHSDNDLITGVANFNFDLLPGGSTKGIHNIQFGIIYEQRALRNYAVAPYGLWNIARLQANRHILGVDTASIIGYAATDPFFAEFYGIDSFAVFDHLISTNPDVVGELQFYKSVREVTGQGLKEFVNVDALSPDQLSLDMFSAQELNDQAILGYYGYDYLGNKLSSDVTFNDFFTSTDPATSIRDFPVAAWRPNYQAAYIQDKFKVGDMILRLGLRVDRYDANTKVLKDPYSLYEIKGAKDFHAADGSEKPSTIGDDYKVYVDGQNSDNIKAYRSGDQWYFANGTPANDGNVIFGGGVVYPSFVNEDANIRDRNFDINSSFADYQPQININPRLSFSFPISDIANFFAHYDVLSQRPNNNFVSALGYYYFNDPGRTPTSNPNLRPERTIDYEVGFQQRLSNSSALKVAAYYKEMRDMIQARTYLYLPSPVTNYESFGNLDFGTVKGFTFQYDLRRTRNIMTTISYTLQFADGTGSDTESQRGLTNRGNIRYLFPLNFDERHRIAGTIDYRYDSGKAYNGPRWFGADVFSRAGANIQVFAVSGRPYTAKFQPQPFGGSGTLGSINGNRLPWNFTVDFRIDKSFTVGKSDTKSGLEFNVYFRVQNLLNTRNVIGVYPVTGAAEDDGYLTSSRGQDAIQTIQDAGRNLQSYLDVYRTLMLNPNNYTLPRRLFVGLITYF